MLTVFGLSMSVSLSETAKAADETTTEVAEVNDVKFATLAEAVNAVSDGGEIVVYSGVYTIPNVTYTEKSFTISAGVDQTVSFDMSVAHAIHGAKVSFNNVTFDYKTNNNYIGLQHADTLTYTGCTINGMVFLYATNETFNGCTFNQTSKNAYNVWTYGAKNVVFNQCVFNSAGKSVLVYNEGANPKTDLTVSETKFVASEKVDGKAAIEIDTSLMAGGTTITIDGKTTATDFAAGSNSGNTLWNDKKQTADTNKNTTITVADKVVYAPYVVAIGEVKYFSLTAAIAAAKDGETVKLLADVEQNSEVSINKNITLDLNGKKIYNTKDIWHDTDPVIVSLIAIRDGAEVTVMGDGTIAAKADDCYTIDIVNGKLTIENGTFVGNISVVQVENGELTINGGTFSLIQKMTDGKGEDRYLINCIDKAFVANAAKVAIYGGSFAGFDPNVSPEKKVDGKVPSFAAPGVGITKNEDGSFTAKANMAAQILDSDGNSVEAYATLAEAIAAAKDGETVKLLADCSGNGIQIKSGRFADKGLTVDFGGYTYTVGGVLVGSAGTGTNAFQLLQGNKITFQNGTIKGVSKNTKPAEDTPNWHGAPAMVIQNYCDLTLKNMTVSGGDETVYTMSNNNGDVVIEDTTINVGKAKGYGYGPFAFDVCRYDTYLSVSVTVRGNSVINGNVEISGGIGEGQNRQLNVENGTFKGTFNVSGNVPANIAISGGKFNHAILPEYCAEGFIPQDNGDGTFGVKEGTYVAEVNGVKYETLQAAFDAAKTGDTVKLLTDITLTAQVNITKALNGLTLDGNGKTITCATTTDVFTSGGSALYFGNATDKLYCTGIKIKDLTMTGKARFAIFLCGGTTTEFTNVNISGEYYIAVNLYGTHGATMTNCTISNSTIGTDKYISGVWSNVASANPLRLVSTTVDVIAINAYTTANTLAPKIFIDKNSSAEVHTFDDGSVSYNKKLCVSTESEGSYTVKEYFNSEWVDTYVAEVKGVKYETLQAAIDDAAPRNAIVTLLANTRENVTIAKAYLTLDLNGHTINGGTEKGKPAVTVKARVTIKDSSAAQTGTIMREDTAGNSGVSSHYVIDVQDGWLTFEGGKVINNSGNAAGKGASLVRVGDDSVAKYPGLNIKGGTFTQDNFIVIKVDRGDLSLNGGTLNSANSYAIETWHRATVKNGTVNGAVSSWVYSGGLNSTLEISGGTINGNVTSVNYGNTTDKKATVSVTGGTITGELDTRSYDPATGKLTSINDAAKATIEVSGGTFSTDPTKYVVEESAIIKNENGTYGVEKAYLAKVGDTSYYTMDEAFKAQTASGEAIVMLRDYTTGSTFNSGTKHRVVDLNGHTWTYTGTDTNSAAFEINNPNATLTVKNGTIISSTIVGLIPSAMGGTIKYDNAGLVFEGVTMTSNGSSGIETNGNNTNDSVTLKDSTLNVPNGFGIYFPSSGTLTIENSKITAKTMGVQVCSGKLNINAGSAITVKGDAVPKAENDGAIQDGAAISIVNRTGYKGLSNIVITGGTFTAKAGNDAIKAYDWVNKVESTFTKADLVAVSGGTFTSAVPAEYCADRFIPTQNEDGTYGVKEGTYVAKIGEVGYETLAEAIAAATDGQTVMLLTRVAENVVIDADKNFTLDLNGFTLNGGTGNKNAAILNNGTLVITDSSAAKTGTIKRDDNGDRGYYVILNLGTMTIEQANVVNNSGHDGSSLIRNGGNDTKVSTLTINGGEFTQNDFIAIKNDSTAVLNINGGIINSENQSAVQNWSTAHILGGTLNGILWTLTYDETTIGKTVFGGEAVLNGRIYAEKFSQNVTVEPYVSITGGKLNVTKYKVENSEYLKVSGGTFSSEVNKDYLANGFVVNKNTNGTYGVTAGSGFAGACVVVTESLAMKVVVSTASKYVVVTYKGLDGIAKTVRFDKFTDIRIEDKDYKYCLFDQIMPQMIDVKFSFELYGENDVMLDRKANYSVVDYLAHIIASDKDSVAFRNVAASLIEYANRAKTVKGLTTIAPEFVKGTEKVDLTELYKTFIADEKNKIPAKDTVKAEDISKGDAQVIYKAKVVFDDAYTLTFYTNDNEKQYTYKLDDKVIVFDENGEYTVNVLAQNITTKYVLAVYDKDSKLVQTVTYGVSTYCIRMQETETPQGELYVASYYYGVAVNQYGTANPNSVQG